MRFAEAELDGMIIRMAPLGAIATNCYVVGCAKTHKAAIIDSSGEEERIANMVVKAPELEVTHLLQTHAHIDHVAALSGTKARYPDAPIVIHKDEMPLYDAAPTQGKFIGISIDALPAPDQYVEEGQTIAIGDLEAEVLVTPGHTPGGICFYFKRQNVIFSGDLLFAGSIGRTDLPGGHFPTIEKSLARMKTLPPKTLVLSGHGPETTIELELKRNPFLR